MLSNRIKINYFIIHRDSCFSIRVTTLKEGVDIDSFVSSGFILLPNKKRGLFRSRTLLRYLSISCLVHVFTTLSPDCSKTPSLMTDCPYDDA